MTVSNKLDYLSTATHFYHGACWWCSTEPPSTPLAPQGPCIVNCLSPFGSFSFGKNSRKQKGLVFLDTEPTPPGEEESSFAESAIKSKLDSYSDSPVIGLEYLVEISGSRLEDPSFKCLLCDSDLNEDGVIPDITSTKHRLEYLVRTFSFSWPSAVLSVEPARF